MVGCHDTACIYVHKIDIKDPSRGGDFIIMTRCAKVVYALFKFKGDERLLHSQSA